MKGAKKALQFKLVRHYIDLFPSWRLRRRLRYKSMVGIGLAVESQRS